MIPITVKQAAETMSGRILAGSPDVVCTGVHIDSRLVEPGDLFFAIKAGRDGHAFIPEARRKGAAGSVVSENIASPGNGFVMIKVNDTLAALQQMAHSVRKDSQACIIGITGSVGKTTTKSFTAHLLSRKYNVLESRGNFNNHLGLPLSLLDLRPEHKVAVLEMAMRAPGEIACLSRIAEPDVAVITNIRPVHLEYFKGIEEIAQAKKEILDEMNPSGTAVLNHNDPLVRNISKDWRGRSVWYGHSPRNEIAASEIRKKDGSGLTFLLKYGDRSEPVFLPLLYDSYIDNFLACAAVAYILGINLETVVETAETLQPLPNRGRLFSLEGGIHLVDDSYNSNPAALEASLHSLSGIPAERKVAVLGDMLELGPKENSFHYSAGIQVGQMGWDILVTIGSLSRQMVKGALDAGMKSDQLYSFTTSEDAAVHIGRILRCGDLVLVKGSRGIETEKVVKAIKERG